MHTIIVLLSVIVFTVYAGASESKFLINTALVGMSKDYREYDKNDVILDSEKSKLNEMVGSEFRVAYLEEYEKSSAEIGMDLLIVGGKTQYVGSLLTSSLGYGSYIGTTYNFLYDLALNYRYSKSLGSGLEVHTGIGLGYRWWRRELSASQIEVYTWASLRPEIGMSYSIGSLNIGAFLEYQWGFDEKMAILANSENPQTSVNLGFANILQVNIPITLQLNDSVALFMAYTYEQQKIGDSNSVPYIIDSTNYEIYEPRSTANNSYVKLGVSIEF